MSPGNEKLGNDASAAYAAANAAYAAANAADAADAVYAVYTAANAAFCRNAYLLSFGDAKDSKPSAFFHRPGGRSACQL